jgi:hypothetical protein
MIESWLRVLPAQQHCDFISLSPRGILHWPEEQGRSGCGPAGSCILGLSWESGTKREDLSPSALGLRSGFEPPDPERPGRQLHQQGLSEARLSCQDESLQLGTQDLEVVSSPRISLGPAGSRINRDYARRVATTSHPSMLRLIRIAAVLAYPSRDPGTRTRPRRACDQHETPSKEPKLEAQPHWQAGNRTKYAVKYGIERRNNTSKKWGKEGGTMHDDMKEQAYVTENGKRVKRGRGLLWSLVFGGCAFPPVSLGPAGDCPCKD